MSPPKMRAEGLLIYKEGSPNVVGHVFATSALVDGSASTGDIYVAGSKLARVFSAAGEMLELLLEVKESYRPDSEIGVRILAVIEKATKG